MKQEISPKIIIAVVALGVVILAGVAFMAFRAPSATAANTTPAATAGGSTNTGNQTAQERGRERAREMREMHSRGRREER